MKIKRAISLLLTVLLLITMSLNEPLSLVVTQAAQLETQAAAQAGAASEDDSAVVEGLDDEADTEDIYDEGVESQDETDQEDTTDVIVDDESQEIVTEDESDSEVADEEVGLDERPDDRTRAVGDIAINATNFPDPYFRAYVERGEWRPGRKINQNGDGTLSLAERNAVTQIDVSEWYVKSLKGIEHFTNLDWLICYDNPITSVDLSKNTKLKTLSISKTSITSLNLSNNTQLTSLTCNNNKLTSLNLSNLTRLKHLECQNNSLSSLNLSSNTQLDWLNCNNNRITSLNLSTNTKLEYLECANNSLTSLNISNNTGLAFLDCSNNRLTSLNTSSNTGLLALICTNNKITSLNFNSNRKLIQILCSNNAMSSLEIPNSLRLEYLEFMGQTGMRTYKSNIKETSDKSMNATWQAVSGASGYDMYRCDRTYVNWESVAKGLTGTSYKDPKVRLGETYIYMLYAYQNTATAKRYFAYSISDVGNITVPIPQNLRANIATASSIDVSWNRVANASGYTLYVSTSRNGTYTSLGNMTANSFRHAGLKAGTTYYYKIRAYAQLGPERVYSNYSSDRAIKQIVPKVAGVKVTNNSANSLRVSWSRVADASGYEVYQATSKNGKYKRVATIKKNSTITYTAKKLSHKKTYHYKVRAYRNVDGIKRNGAFSSIVKRKVILAKPALTAQTRSRSAINLSWQKVSGAKEYEIYRATKKNGKYKKIKTTKALKFTNTKLKRNRTYYYKIKAVQKIGNKTYKSANSATRSARTAK